MEKDRDAGHLYDRKDIDQAAAESKKATDAVFYTVCCKLLTK
jgi:hypothetical protein